MRTILHTEASLGLGGQDVRIVAESRCLRDQGWGAFIACQPESRLFAEARTAGVDAVAVPMRNAVDLGALLAFRRLMKAFAVDLVHTHSSTDSWSGALAAKALGLPVVRSRHVSIAIRSALVYRLADRIVTSGEAVRAIVVRAGIAPERVVAIPPGVDTARFHPAVSGKTVRDELRLGAGELLVGMVANIRGSKGHNVFLEAAREILRQAPLTRFLIVGDGVGYDEVRRRVSDLGLAEHATMTGFRRDIPEVMAALDVLVLPSIRSEATSQVIPQALAVGTPVVATTVGGSPELVRDGETARLVPPGKPAALAAAIVDMLADAERAHAMAQAGQALVHERFTVDAMMAATTA